MKVIFPVKQFQKLRAYVESVSTEISGLGKIKRVDNNFIVEELEILDQVVTDGYTMLKKNAYGDFMDKKMVAGEDLSAWKLWWHSHGTVHDAYFSSMDQLTIKDADNETDRQNWTLSLVTDSKGAIRIRLDIFYPAHVTVENIPYEISFRDKILEEEVFNEVQQKVTLQQPKPLQASSQENIWMPTQNTRTAINVVKKILGIRPGLPFLSRKKGVN